MPRFATATVSEILVERAGLQRVDTDAGRAYVLTGLIGPVAVGDRVVLNTTAVDLGLGTGGWHVVHWNLARDGWSQPGPGHIMKLRYTSLQVDTGAAEETRPDLPEALDGLPVVACSLHSQVAVVAAVVRHLRPAVRIAYVMTDGAARPRPPRRLGRHRHRGDGAGRRRHRVVAGDHGAGGRRDRRCRRRARGTRGAVLSGVECRLPRPPPGDQPPRVHGAAAHGPPPRGPVAGWSRGRGCRRRARPRAPWPPPAPPPPPPRPEH